jgi:hypothetical protein
MYDIPHTLRHSSFPLEDAASAGGVFQLLQRGVS